LNYNFIEEAARISIMEGSYTEIRNSLMNEDDDETQADLVQ
jgi:hypothetical protein